MRIVRKAFVACCFVLSCAATSALAEGPAAAEFKNHDGGFAGKDGEFVIDAGAGSGRLAALKEFEPGQYVITGEYKTEGMEALSRFAIDSQTSDGKTPLSAYEFNSATSDWAPLAVHINLDAKCKPLLRVGNWQKCKDAESKLVLRNLQIKTQEWTDGTNLLVNGDFEQGAVGSLPANWYWKLGKEKDVPAGASYALAKNTSFKTGKNVLQLVAPAGEVGVMLNSRSLNLPQGGRVELTFSAKAAKTGTVTPWIVQGWGGQYTKKALEVSEEWKQYSMKYSFVPDPKKKFFFVRMDLAAGPGATVEIADMKLIYHAPAGSASKPAAAVEDKKPAAAVVDKK